MAETTAVKRARLDYAWNAAKVANSSAPDLRGQLLLQEQRTLIGLSAGAIKQNIANGHTTEFFSSGPGTPTMADVVETWRELITRYDEAFDFLFQCTKYGLDPVATELQGFPCPPTVIVNPTPSTLPADAYEWLMGSVAVAGSSRGWTAHLIPIYEGRSDYSELTTGAVPWI